VPIPPLRFRVPAVLELVAVAARLDLLHEC
jgi:hypothetical protein